jgi:predicted acyltransferase (DUF342 family)
LPFDKRTLVLPSGTVFDEHAIVTRGDVVVSDGVESDFGFATPDRVFLGERVRLGGPVEAGGDVRADMFTRIAGNVRAGGSAYLGERVEIGGKLSVEMDLDVGDDVKIEQGFEARGWINIRNPIPVVMYIFIYLMQLVQLGRSEEVERILKELDEGEDAPLAVSEVYLYVPEGSAIGLSETRIKGNALIADDCRVLGNWRVDGFASLGKGVKLHGALRADGDVTLEDLCEVHGDIVADGEVRIGNGCHIYGAITARRVEMRQSALIDGAVTAREGVRFLTPELVGMREKVETFEAGNKADVMDLLG